MIIRAPYPRYTSLRGLFCRPWQSFVILLAFLVNTFGPIPTAQAQDFRLPAPGTMVSLSPAFAPPELKGIKVHPNNPFRFDFILDAGDDVSLRGAQATKQSFIKEESTKLIKYFLASITIPEKDLWVNLSPYEKDRIIPNSFGLTEMGRDLLAEDYMLKQITASLIYPEDDIGKKFWKRIYKEAAKRFGTTNVPVNTFNKVWIVPEKAVVYENAKAGTAYVVESKLKVMLEQDYLSLQKHEGIQSGQIQIKDTNKLGSQIVREIIIPELTKEVNEDKNFARLRQIYNSLILAIWYKKKIKESILAQVYSDKNKVAGINIDDPKEKERIYQRYLRAFKKGVFNFIKEDVDPATQETIPRKYFSGGLGFTPVNMDAAMSITSNPDFAMPSDNLDEIDSDVENVGNVVETGEVYQQSGVDPIKIAQIEILTRIMNLAKKEMVGRAILSFGLEITRHLESLRREIDPNSDQKKDVWDFISKLDSNSGTRDPLILRIRQDKVLIDALNGMQTTYMFRYPELMVETTQGEGAFKEAVNQAIKDYKLNGKTSTINFAIVGAAYGQEPISWAIAAQRVIDQEFRNNGLSPIDAVELKIHVFSKRDDPQRLPIYQKVKDNQIIYSAEEIAGRIRSGTDEEERLSIQLEAQSKVAPFLVGHISFEDYIPRWVNDEISRLVYRGKITPEEFKKYFIPLNGGFRRSKELDKMLVFHDFDLGDGQPSDPNLPESYVAVMANNVLQHVSDSHAPKIAESLEYFGKRLNPQGIISFVVNFYFEIPSRVKAGLSLLFGHNSEYKMQEIERSSPEEPMVFKKRDSAQLTNMVVVNNNVIEIVDHAVSAGIVNQDGNVPEDAAMMRQEIGIGLLGVGSLDQAMWSSLMPFLNRYLGLSREKGKTGIESYPKDRLENEDWHIREDALKSLRLPVNEEETRILVKLLEDPYPIVRNLTWGILSQLTDSNLLRELARQLCERLFIRGDIGIENQLLFGRHIEILGMNAFPSLQEIFQDYIKTRVKKKQIPPVYKYLVHQPLIWGESFFVAAYMRTGQADAVRSLMDVFDYVDEDMRYGILSSLRHSKLTTAPGFLLHFIQMADEDEHLFEAAVSSYLILKGDEGRRNLQRLLESKQIVSQFSKFTIEDKLRVVPQASIKKFPLAIRWEDITKFALELNSSDSSDRKKVMAINIRQALLIGGQKAYSKLYDALTTMEAGNLAVRPAFRSMEELKNFLRVNYEYSISVLEDPQNWSRELMSQKFILCLSRLEKLEVFIHEIDKMFEEEDAFEKLKELGIVSEKGKIVIFKGENSNTDDLRFGISGHSHPYKSVAEPSLGDNSVEYDFGQELKEFDQKEGRDRAQLIHETAKGGIDLTPANMNIQIKTESPTGTFGNDKNGIKFHLDPALLEQLQNAPGFVPVIINIQPMTNLRVFLGLNNETEGQNLPSHA